MKKLPFVFFLFSMFTPASGQYVRARDSLTKAITIRRIDSLKKKLAFAKEDTATVNLYLQVAENLHFYDEDSAFIYSSRAFILSRKIKWEQGEAKSISHRSVYFFLKSDYPRMLFDYLYCFKIFEGLKDTTNMTTNLQMIGILYKLVEDHPKSLEYESKAYMLAKYLHNRNLIWSTSYNLANAYANLKRTDSAQVYYQVSYDFANQISDAEKSHRLGWSLHGLGRAQILFGNVDLALSFFYKSLSYTSSYDPYLFSDLYQSFSEAYLKKGMLDSSIKYSRSSLQLAITIHYMQNILAAYRQLAKVYRGTQNDSAVKYYTLELELRDSLFSANNQVALANLTSNEQDRQKELEAQRQQSANRLKMLALVAVTSIILLIAFFLWRNNHHKQRAYTLLQQQKRNTDIQKAKVEKTLEELRTTQAQLIQREKMASLGELTAGIAHEIQNPLNFVNNFSEVNKEMIDELQTELETGNTEEAIAISKDIKENEEKINHHGKRADAIVKGMLQHSRASTGKKEPTYINALADEYLRLSYHGLRAKDKNFNATIETHFDKSIGKIEVVPQDIGRVLLNLYNNAFYAVNARQKAEGESFQPIVKIQTKKVDSKVEIVVTDNGNGIPQNIINKIFQPFFTTKPTGQGTGLGLSLSYDIIKAHGGELKVETKEGEFTQFLIIL